MFVVRSRSSGRGRRVAGGDERGEEGGDGLVGLDPPLLPVVPQDPHAVRGDCRLLHAVRLLPGRAVSDHALPHHLRRANVTVPPELILRQESDVDGLPIYQDRSLLSMIAFIEFQSIFQLNVRAKDEVVDRDLVVR